MREEGSAGEGRRESRSCGRHHQEWWLRAHERQASGRQGQGGRQDQRRGWEVKRRQRARWQSTRSATTRLKNRRGRLAEVEVRAPPTFVRRGPLVSQIAILMIFAWVNSSSPSWPISAPKPDCFAPLNGTSGGRSRCLFTHTVPESIFSATS